MNLWEVVLDTEDAGAHWGTYYLIADDWNDAVKKANIFCESETKQDKVSLHVSSLKESYRIVVPSILPKRKEKSE
jgi:hypothetical protein